MRWLLIALVAISTAGAFALTVEMPEEADFGISPVRCLKQVPTPSGPDVYQFDWPVDPGRWPLVDSAGHLRYPMGAYGGGYYPGRYSSVAEWWQKSGFDFAQAHIHVEGLTSAAQVVERYREYLLDPAQRAGGRIMIHPPYIMAHMGPQIYAEVVRELARHPALYGWDPRDEPADGDPTWIDSLKLIRAYDRKHPILLNITTSWRYEQLFAGVAPDKPDFLSTDWYPVQEGGSVHRIAEWADKVAGTCRALDVDSQFIIGNFAGHEGSRVYPWYKFPGPETSRKHFGRLCTVEEARSQVYQCLIYGIQQLQWWPYEDWARGEYGDRAKDLGFEMERLNREVHALTGPIFSRLTVPVTVVGEAGKRVRERDLHVRASVYRDALYIIVTCSADVDNAVPAQTTPATLDLGAVPEVYRSRFGDTAEVMFEMDGKDERGRPIYVKDSRGDWRQVEIDRESWTIEDTFGPYGVHIYRIPMSVAPTT